MPRSRRRGTRSGGSDASIADEIAHRTLHVIEEKWDEDPVFFDKFSKLIQETIDAFRERRLEERAYLGRIRNLRDRVDAREDDDDPTPAPIRGKGNETAFWGIARAGPEAGRSRSRRACSRHRDRDREIISQQRTVGWQHDRDAQNRIRNAIDDYFFDNVMRPGGAAINPAEIDAITDDILASARVRMADDGRLR